jgi:hypothetical protein
MDHDYKKRDYLLPEGGKDLIDVLRLNVQPVQEQPSALRSLPPIIGEMTVADKMTVADLATLLKQKPFKIIADLMELGVFANVHETIVFEAIAQVVRRYGYAAKKEA